jgi:cell division protease FtsH
MLQENRDKLQRMAEALMKYETLDNEQIDEIMEGKEPRPPKGWSDDEPSSGSGTEVDAKQDEKSNGKIGGPASQH